MKWVLKTSAVRVSTDTRDGVYRSIEEVPSELRAKIRRTLEGRNAETIFIANQEAYDRIVQKADDLPADMKWLNEPRFRVPKKRNQANWWGWRFAWAVGFSVLALLCFVFLWLIQAGTP